MTPGRNDPCPCGSGKKYKHCCLRAQEAVSPDGREALEALILQIERDGEVMQPGFDPAIPRELREALGLRRWRAPGECLLPTWRASLAAAGVRGYR
ncbi:MAG: SEC-C domain-containing protein [Gemmatimonadetes bacterium]|nr:SEC-C domain-containing protein [Gemmatimonadota bacterium]